MKTKHLFRPLLFSVLFLLVSQLATAQIFINEFAASNDASISDESGAFEDWVELYNAGSSPVDIANYYVSDDLATPTLWQIPATSSSETTISAGGYLILWFDKDIEEGVLHVDAKLSSSGENIVLTAPDGLTTVDTYTYGIQTTGVSEGRITDGASGFIFFATPTPNAANSASSGISPLPEFSILGGQHLNSQVLTLSTSIPADIYYTTNGSEPDENSNLYSSPINIDTPTSVRAIAIADNLAPSRMVTQSYLIGVSHVYPILAIAGDSLDFFDDVIGIFGNISEDIEINVNVEFYEPDGTLGFNQLVESELVGVSSTTSAQKSMALKAKGSLGNSTFDYPIFPDEDLTEYRGLVLRNSGNDWNTTMFRDAAATSLISNLSDTDDLIETPKINYQPYRPSIVYLNGAYWGIYNLRERADKRYIKNHFDLDDDEIDFIENELEVKKGDIENWNSLQLFLAENDFSEEANFMELKDWVDTEYFMDNAIFNIFIDNQDWPGNNNRRFRERADSAQWQFLTYDLDFSFGLLTSAGWNTDNAQDDALDRLMNPSLFEHPNPEWSTRIFTNLIDNETWRNDFINRTADHMNVLFTPARISQRIDDFIALFAPELQLQLERWLNLYNQEENAELMKSFGNARTDAMHTHFINAFSDIDGTAEISISTQPSGAGSVEFSTLNIDEEDDVNAWVGTYFTGIDIPVKAVAKPGFAFQNWLGLSSDATAETIINLSANGDLVAVFEPVSLVEEIINNELVFNLEPTLAQDFTNLTFNQTLQSGAQVYVSDALGRLVFARSLETSSVQLQINTSDWTAGAYFVAVSTGDKMGVHRLVIMR